MFKQLAAFFPPAACSQIPEREAQIVLGQSPILRQVGFRLDLQSALVGGHRLFKQLAAFFPTARSQIPKREAQIVLGPGPILRQIGFRPGPPERFGRRPRLAQATCGLLFPHCVFPNSKSVMPRLFWVMAQS